MLPILCEGASWHSFRTQTFGLCCQTLSDNRREEAWELTSHEQHYHRPCKCQQYVGDGVRHGVSQNGDIVPGSKSYGVDGRGAGLTATQRTDQDHRVHL